MHGSTGRDQAAREVQSLAETAQARDDVSDLSKPQPELQRLAALLTAMDIVSVVDTIGQKPGSTCNILLYRSWLESHPDDFDRSFAIWFNLGVQYAGASDWNNAVAAYRRALRLKADFYPAALNLGTIFESAGLSETALESWGAALQPDAVRTALLNNRGRVFENAKDYANAEREYRRSLLTDPDQPAVLHHWIGLRTKTCSWPVYEASLPGVTRADMVAATRALTLLALSDDLAAQTHGNASWIAEKLPAVGQRLAPESPYGHRKLRIGYLSSDFCMHPVSFLTAELFELHDRNAFEIYGYCSTIDDGSAVRQQIVDAFDVFVPIRTLDDEQAGRRIREDEIDILVDLNGLTLGTRLQILRWRPAPVQITYLGYNGPIPLPELDYIIADPVVIPPDQACRHAPPPLYMPRCFQVNDRRLPVAPCPTRGELGLPEDGFVFCSFSNTYKISEPMFDAWTEILRRVERSVLWLYVDNVLARSNLLTRAQQRGLAAERIIFAERAEPSLYRSRLALADIFLDTHPYNAGTTASDALRVGLPIVTLCGETFIARMATSLLRAMEVEDGIAASIADYVEMAVGLGTDGARYAALRDRVAPGRWAETLGDTPQVVSDLETLYRSVARRSAASPMRAAGEDRGGG